MRMILFVLLGLALAGGAAWGAIQYAIATNGPAVVNAVDRLSGGAVSPDRSEPIAFGAHPQQRLFVQRAAKGSADAPHPVLVFIHGGSWASGDPEDYGFVERTFARQGIVVVDAGYRLGKEGRYPAMLQDGAAALAWTVKHIGEYGGDPSRIFLMGHSAGAYNAAMLGLDPRWLAEEGLTTDRIKGIIALAGPFDFYPFDVDSTRDAFGHTDKPQDTQPVNHVRPGAPPMLLIHGEADTTVRPRNSRELAKRLKEAGDEVETHFYPGWDHADPLLMLAKPWKSGYDVVSKTTDFMQGHDNASLAVQAQSR